MGRKAQASSGAGPAISAWNLGQPNWTPRNYAQLAEEAYVRNAIAYRCTAMIASAAASIPWMLRDKSGKEIEQHALLDLLTRPGPMIGGQTLFEAFFAYLLLSGNGYMEGVGPSPTRPPTELWTHRPDRMTSIAGPFGMPKGFRYEAHGIVKTWDVDQVTGEGPILHLRLFHPLNDWYGLSPIEPAAYGIDRHNAASAHNKALLDNGARPSGALIFKPIKQGQGQGVVSTPPEVIKAAEARLADRHGGPDNAGRPLVLGGDIDWKEMGISPREMDFGEGKNDAARDICTGFGVPHVLIVTGSATYNNVKEARLQLYEDTVLPLAERARDALNAWLTPRFDDRLTLEHDLDEIPALEPRRETKRKATVELWKSGLLTRDEARADLEYEPVGGPAGEELAIPSVAGEEPSKGGEQPQADPKPEPPKA